MIKPTTEEFAFIRQLIYQDSGLLFSEEKDYLLESRLRSLARKEGFKTLSELVHELRNRSSIVLRRALIEEIVIGETYFFRDSHPFETLRTIILPNIMRNPERLRHLNVWCAAASTGQEPYSVAMTLAEAAGELSGWNIRVMATDISENALKRARQGCYSEPEISRGISEAFRSKYFRQTPEGWHIGRSIQERVEFVRLNLIETWPSIPPMDIVFMRNVLIYFDEATRDSIFRRLQKVVRPGGYVILGTSETPVHGIGGFLQVRFGQTICYHREP